MKWGEMTPKEQEVHMEYVRSEQGMKDWKERHNKLEAICALVTPEIAAERELQEVVLADDDVIRFRENTMVSVLTATTSRANSEVEQWMVEQFALLTQEGEKGNGVVRWLVENGPADMNVLGEQGMFELDGRGFSQKDKEQFAMLIGYSVSGAGDLSYFSDAMIGRADRIAEEMRKNR